MTKAEAVARSPTSTSEDSQGADTERSRIMQDDEGHTRWTVAQTLAAIGMGRFQLRLLLLLGFVFMADALEVALLSYLQPILTYQWDLSPAQAASISSLVFGGQFVGSFVFGKMADKYGRRCTFLVCAGLVCACGLLSAAAPNAGLLMAARAGVGFGIGGFTVPFDLLAECLPPAIRGKILLSFMYFWTIGSLVLTCVAWALLPTDPVSGWRWLAAVAAVPVGVASVGYCLVPESPTFLAANGRTDEARVVLRRAAAMNGVVLPDALVIVPPALEVGDESVRALWAPDQRRTTVISWLVWGAIGLSYYGVVLLTPAMFPDGPAPPGVVSINFPKVLASTAAELVGTSISVLVIERWGRRFTQGSLLIVSGVALLAVLSNASSIVLTGAIISRLAVQAAGSICWVYTAEVFPSRLRGVGHATSSAWARLGAFASPYVVRAGYGLSTPIWVYACAAIVAGCGVFAYPKDTMGAPLKEREASLTTAVVAEGERNQLLESA